MAGRLRRLEDEVVVLTAAGDVVIDDRLSMDEAAEDVAEYHKHHDLDSKIEEAYMPPDPFVARRGADERSLLVKTGRIARAGSPWIGEQGRRPHC